MGRFLILTRSVAVVIAVAAIGIAVPVIKAQAQRGEIAITCMNKTSGATWQIKIDYDRSTVDSNPASISASTISWKDWKDGWNYTLDRKSGDLTVILASATGGNMLFDRCKLEN
jgi:hypothetical protein